MVPIGYFLLHHCLCGDVTEISVVGIKRKPHFRITRLWVPVSKEVEVFPASRRTAEEKGDKNLFNLYFNKFSYQKQYEPRRAETH